MKDKINHEDIKCGEKHLFHLHVHVWNKKNRLWIAVCGCVWKKENYTDIRILNRNKNVYVIISKLNIICN